MHLLRILKRFCLLLTIIFLCLISSCAEIKSNQTPSKPSFAKSNFPDYSNLYYWAAHPAKHDPSDSTPLPYRNFLPDSTVDVFFIHPTTYTSDSSIHESLLSDSLQQKRWNAPINDDVLNTQTDNKTILFQASVFNHYRVFAPRYRQAHVRAFYISDSMAAPFFDTAYADIKHAFAYYLAHENMGRPFIIAAHSQGTLHAARLIKEQIENTDLEDRMIAAYIIGLPVAENYFTNCAPCSTAAQTNCIISWRTFKNGYEPPKIQQENFKAIVVNPLTWNLDSLPASKSLNKGAVLFKYNKPIGKAVSAQVHGNILWAGKPHFFGSLFFIRKNYHIGDINLFWKNIRENVDERVKAYKAQKQIILGK